MADEIGSDCFGFYIHQKAGEATSSASASQVSRTDVASQSSIIQPTISADSLPCLGLMLSSLEC